MRLALQHSPPRWFGASVRVVELAGRSRDVGAFLSRRPGDPGRAGAGHGFRGRLWDLRRPAWGRFGVILFFTAFLTQFVDADRGSVALQLLTLGLILQSAGLAVDAAFGLAAGTVRDIFVRRPGLYAVLERVAAGVFGVLALALFIEVLL